MGLAAEEGFFQQFACCPFDDPDHFGEDMGSAVILLMLSDSQQANALPFAWFHDSALGKDFLSELARIFPPGIPLDDVGEVLLIPEKDPVLQGVMGGINANQELFLRNQCPCLFKYPLHKGNKSILAVLAARPQLYIKSPAFQAKVGRDRSVTVKVVIGPADVLFFGTGVVQGKDIRIQGNMSGCHRTDVNPALFQHLHSTPANDRQQLLRCLIQPLLPD